MHFPARGEPERLGLSREFELSAVMTCSTLTSRQLRRAEAATRPLKCCDGVVVRSTRPDTCWRRPFTARWRAEPVHRAEANWVIVRAQILDQLSPRQPVHLSRSTSCENLRERRRMQVKKKWEVKSLGRGELPTAGAYGVGGVPSTSNSFRYSAYHFKNSFCRLTMSRTL